MKPEALISFVQDQFGRIDRWCWETIIEEVAEHRQIALNPDNMTYAGGSMRVGPYQFRRNDAAWRLLCEGVSTNRQEALRVIDEVVKALESKKSAGVATAWSSTIWQRVESTPSDHRRLAEEILCWKGLEYRDSTDFSPEISGGRGIVYGLWRLGEDGRTIVKVPIYIGEASGSMHGRIAGARNKSHRDWWGDGKPIGVSLVKVDPARRKEIERYLIDVLLPFCNVSNSRFVGRWNFPQP